MNYLAHARLSFDDPAILTGNMISDFVKGKKKFEYPPDIQKGILLHRSIDNFTDTHEATREAKEIFRPAYRLYSGAFVDVVYDHFLANDSHEFPPGSLESFTSEVYEVLQDQHQWLPLQFALMFPHMRVHNWLLNYRTIEGIGKSFEGLVRRSTYLTEGRTALELLTRHYQLLQDCYRHFWVDMLVFARNEFEQLLSGNE